MGSNSVALYVQNLVEQSAAASLHQQATGLTELVRKFDLGKSEPALQTAIPVSMLTLS